MATYRDRLVAGLGALGWTPDIRATTRKYEVFINDNGTVQRLFVGPSGALRAGACATKSFSVGCPRSERGFYLKVLTAGDKALGHTQAAAPVAFVPGSTFTDAELLAMVLARGLVVGK